MATTRWRHPENAEVSQVKTFTITAASSAGSATWTFTLTLEDGATVTVSFTEDATPTIAEIVTGLKDAWNNSTNPDVSKITATESGSDVILTADTAGVPFNVTLADDADGTHTSADTTANVGNSDYGTARNWELDAIPVAADDVVFPIGSVDVLYGLDQSGVAIGDFKVLEGCESKFGRFTDGEGYYLILDPNTFKYEGKSSRNLFSLQTGGTQIDAEVIAHGSPPQSGKHALYLVGDNLGDVEVFKGNVGVGVLEGDTATISKLLCGFLDNLQSDVDLTVGSGVTLTTLVVYGGRCTVFCDVTTIEQSLSTNLWLEGSASITTLNAHGTVYPNNVPAAGDAIGTLNVHGTVDFSRDRRAKTIGTLNAKRGGRIILHDQITITTYNPLAEPGDFKVEYVK